MIKYSGILLLFLTFFSCNKEDMTFQIGSKFLDVKTNIRYIDTLSVHSFTVKLDSVRTSDLAAPSMLVGKYFDPEFGHVSARSFFRVNPPNTTAIPKNAVYDSLKLIMLYSGYAIGDTNVTYTIKAHRLFKPLKARSDGYLYSTSVTEYYPAELGSVSFVPQPNTNDTLWMRLDDALGNDLFALLREKDQIVKESEIFHNYFRGFVLDYDDSDNAVLGFKFPSKSETNNSQYYPIMRLYYHYFDFENTHKSIDFLVGYENVSLQYNQFALSDQVADFPNRQRDKLPAQNSGNISYVQGGTGIITRLEIPYLKNLLALHNNIIIMKAELQLEPVRDSYNTFALTKNVSVYGSDQVNRFGTYFSAGADLTIDEIFQEETRYTFDVTSFIQYKLIEQTNEIPALLVTIKPDDLYKTFDRIVFGSQLNTDKRVKLKIYYINYE